VAPLKHELADGGDFGSVWFPRLQKRGPIEAMAPPPTSTSRPCFHAYKSVAPLKRCALPSRCGRRAGFPRLQKRGPIEAAQNDHSRASSTLFPRLQKRGPIEARTSSASRARAVPVSTLTKAWPH